MKNSIDTIGNQTHGLLACSAVFQPTAPLCAPCTSIYHSKRALHVQQNSFNLTSGNSEILIIGHLSSPKTGSSAFYQYEASSLKRADLRHMIKKKAYKSVCIDCCGIS